MERKIGSRQVLYVITLFFIAQLFGLLLTVLAYVPSYSYITSASSQSSNPVSFIFWLAINIIIAVLIIMLILRYYKGDLFFKLLEAYIIIFGSFFLFFVLIGDIFGALPIIPLSLAALLLAVALFVYKNRTNKFRNAITLITSVGAGIFIGVSIGVSFGFLLLYLLVGVFAIYDYLAVFVLKFMIPFAKEASNRNLAFMIGSSDLELLPKGKLSAHGKKEDLSKITDPKVKALIKSGSVPMVSSVMLGNGDIILPLALTVGSYVVYANIFLSCMIIVGSVVGLIITISLLKKYKVGLPAIPPLFTFISLALMIAFLASSRPDYGMVLLFGVASVLAFAAMMLTLRRMRVTAKLA